MAESITQANNPALWAQLEAMVDDGALAAGWITVGSDNYKILYDTSDTVFFLHYDNFTELIDSRSSKGPKTTYKEINR
jgi:hypothetical protein